MKKLIILLSICIGLLIITCSKIADIDNIRFKNDQSGVESLLVDYSPTGLTTDKTHLSGCTSITIGSIAFSRGNGIPIPPWRIYGKGILIGTSTGLQLNPDGSMPISPNVVICWCNCDCGTGAFSNTFTNLTPNVLYSVRTFAVQSSGPVPPNQWYAGYGEEEYFYINKPNFNCSSATNITGISATVTGFFDDQGCSLPTAVGVCWSTSQNPTISNSHTTITPQAGDDWYWTNNLTGLTPATKYYYRAYITNSQGTFYWTQYNFTTLTCPKFALTGGYVTISPTHIHDGIAEDVDATITGSLSGVSVTVGTSKTIHCTPIIYGFMWNGVNPCWSDLTMYLDPPGYSGAYATFRMELTKSGCPNDVQTAKILVNP